MADPNGTVITFNKSKSLTLIILGCIYLLTSAAYAILAPFFPAVAQERGVHGYQIDLIFAMYPIMKLICSPICGVVLPHTGIVYTIWAGMMLEGGGSLFFGFVSLIWNKPVFLAFCYILRSIQGIGAACYQTSVFALMSSLYPDSVATTLGLLEVFTTIGLMAGPPLGGVLYNAGGFMVPFISLSSLLLLGSFFVAGILPRTAPIHSQSSLKLMKSIICLPRVLIIGMAVILQLAIIGFIDPTFALHITPFNLSIPQVGLIFLAFPATFTLFSPLVGMLADKTGNRPYLILGCLGCAVSLQFIGPATYIPINLTLAQTILAMIGLGLSCSVGLIPSFPDILDAAIKCKHCRNKNRFLVYSVTSGLFNAFVSLGQIIGPVVASVFTTDSNSGFDWSASILGFVLFGQSIIMLILTICEKTCCKYEDASALTEETPASVDERNPLIA